MDFFNTNIPPPYCQTSSKCILLQPFLIKFYFSALGQINSTETYLFMINIQFNKKIQRKKYLGRFNLVSTQMENQQGLGSKLSLFLQKSSSARDQGKFCLQQCFPSLAFIFFHTGIRQTCSMTRQKNIKRHYKEKKQKTSAQIKINFLRHLTIAKLHESSCNFEYYVATKQ